MGEIFCLSTLAPIRGNRVKKRGSGKSSVFPNKKEKALNRALTY